MILPHGAISPYAYPVITHDSPDKYPHNGLAMLFIAVSFVINALWLILSPLSFTQSLTPSLMIVGLMIIISLYSLFRKECLRALYALFILIGVSLSLAIYVPALSNYHAIAGAYPLTIDSEFEIISNRYDSSTTVKLTAIQSVMDSANALNPAALIGSRVRIYNIEADIKNRFQESEIYQGTLTIRPRFFRSIPGDNQRVLQALARKEIGYGKLLSIPTKVQDISSIEKIRNEIDDYFLANYSNGAYLSALSVGKDQHLTQFDWQILRKTGTIHLISISGLHLSLTAFYGFILFRIFFGLTQIIPIQPYKLAAISAIILAWGYALIAGMSIPTIRAAIMFSIAMLTLLIDRPIFSLQGVAIALLVILILMPLTLLMPGFSLSFVAVIILILCARILTTPISAILLTQIVISILLLPLTASFFGEISLVSPLINLFVIPWTSVIIMPAILIGTILLMLYPPFATPFLMIANEGINVLKLSILWASNLPYASIITPKIALTIAILLTLIALFLLYLFPYFRQRFKR